ncbi:MAG: hypothetical protein IPM36_24535 [Lewinellaceae bacterium]|nr:hypothetical protein [Lewinellaceae bacterium]
MILIKTTGFLLFLAIALNACQPVMFFLYGIKKPRPVPDSKIINKALDLGIDTAQLYTLQKEQYYPVLKAISSLPNIRIYDAGGLHYKYWESPDECKAGAAEFIKNLRRDADNQPLNDSAFYRLPLELETLHGSAFAERKLPRDADFYVIVYWGTFLGKLNRDYIESWIKEARENRQVNIHLIYVSCDMRKAWD